VLHVDHVAGLREAIEQGAGQVIVLQERPPLAEAQIRGDQRGLGLVPLLHHREEQADLGRFDLDVPHLVDDQAVVTGVFAEGFLFRVVGQRRIQFG